jgi:hypothetical protein
MIAVLHYDKLVFKYRSFRDDVSPSPGLCREAMRFRLLLAFILVLPVDASDAFNPFPQHLQQPGDDASFARLTVDAGGKTPTVKKLDPAWAKSLADRGEAETYTKSNSNNFSYLGMPVGGIGAGELYLSGDGRLWEWDIFNTRAGGGDGFPVEQGDAYSKPHFVGATDDPSFQTPVAQGFVLRTKRGNQVDTRTLDKDGFADVRFRGQYPIGYVDYADPSCPVKVGLEAFSPYDPGSIADSTYPATALNYTLTNTSSLPVECTLGGWLENGVAPRSRTDNSISVLLGAKAENHAASAMVSETIRATNLAPPDEAEPVGDIGSGTYADWTVEGTAFGSAPMSVHDYSYDFQIIGMADGYFINSRRDGNDDATGKLTSKPFTINRPYLRFRLGGGKNPGQECINLLVDGQVVETATGEGYEVLGQHNWDVTKFQGKTAVLQIIDATTGKDGHILISDIEQGDLPSYPQPLEHREDFGTMAFAALDNPNATEIIPSVQGPRLCARALRCCARRLRGDRSTRRHQQAGQRAPQQSHSGARAKGHALVRRRVGLSQCPPAPPADGDEPAIQRSVQIGDRRRHAHLRRFPAPRRQHAALARHLLRFDAAVVVP